MRIHQGQLNAGLFEAFKRFECASHVALETANFTGVLARILVKWNSVTTGAVTHWLERDKFHHRALLELGIGRLLHYLAIVLP